MAKSKNPYGLSFTELNENIAEGALQLGPDNCPKSYFTQDGKIKSMGFIDINDNLEFYVRNGKIMARFDTPDTRGKQDIIVDVSEGETEYHSEQKIVSKYYNTIGIWQRSSQDFLEYMNCHRYSTLPPKKKRLVQAAKLQQHKFFHDYTGVASGKNGWKVVTGNGGPAGLKNGNANYIGEADARFSGSHSHAHANPIKIEDTGYHTGIHPKTYRSVTMMKPYTVDIALRPTELKNISDLIVIKTGTWASGSWTGCDMSGFKDDTIVWVSPHKVVDASGMVMREATGAAWGLGGDENVHGTYGGATGMFPYLQPTGLKWISSYGYKIADNTMISGSVACAEMQSTGDVIETGKATLQETEFYKYYSGYQPMCATGHWNGVIPAGTPWKIELWSQGVSREIGHRGEIAIIPGIDIVTGNGAKGFHLDISGVGYGVSFFNMGEADIKAFQAAQHDQRNVIKRGCYNSGWCKMSSHDKQYLRYLDPSAVIQKRLRGVSMDIVGFPSGRLGESGYAKINTPDDA